jgi:hypothetical protein
LTVVRPPLGLAALALLVLLAALVDLLRAEAPMAFSILRISLNWLMSWATSAGCMPDPAAMRARREASMRSGSRRSARVIE